MRVNVRTVLEAWRTGRAKGGESISTDGARIFSYHTVIVQREGDGRVLLNRTRYSVTTSQQQSSLAAALPCGLYITGVPMGARDLAPYAVGHGSHQGAQDELNAIRAEV